VLIRGIMVELSKRPAEGQEEAQENDFETDPVVVEAMLAYCLDLLLVPKNFIYIYKLHHREGWYDRKT
jgi:hypothetical protein